MEKRILSSFGEEWKKISSVNKRKKEEHRNIDMISHLPEPLLHYIFSFLDMKQAIQTCILSRRWRHFWVSLPTLNFNYSRRGKDYLKTKNKTNFVDFVNQVLILRDSSNIQKLSVVINEQCDITHHLHTWIFTSVIRNIQELSLQIYTASRCRKSWGFLLRLNNCKSLTKFVLSPSGEYGKGAMIYLPGPGSVTLPRLKTLSIEASLFTCTNSIEGFISQRCLPDLETLILIDCQLSHGPHVSSCLNIKSLKLKHLKMKECYDMQSGINLYAPNLLSLYYHGLTGINLYAPNLLSLYYHGLMFEFFIREKLSSLVKAGMCVKGNPKVFTKEIHHAQHAVTILRDLHNVEELTLSLKILKIVTGTPELLDDHSMQYRKLKCLKLEGTKFSIDRIRDILYMLKASPNIKNLSVTLECFFGCICLHCNETHSNSTNEGDCLGDGFTLQCLKFFEFRNVRTCVSELKFIEILLSNAMMLEKLLIVFGSEGRPFDEKRCRAEFSEKVLTFPRASSSVAIFFK